MNVKRKTNFTAVHRDSNSGRPKRNCASHEANADVMLFFNNQVFVTNSQQAYYKELYIMFYSNFTLRFSFSWKLA